MGMKNTTNAAAHGSDFETLRIQANACNDSEMLACAITLCADEYVSEWGREKAAIRYNNRMAWHIRNPR